MTASTTRRRSRLATVGAFAAAGALLLSACGTDDNGTDTAATPEPAGSDAPLYDLLPEDVQEAGKIRVGTEAAYAPLEYFDEDDNIIGIDPSIGAALAEKLGVEFEYIHMDWGQLIVGMHNNRHDVIMSAMTDTRERQQGQDEDDETGSGGDFVNYFQAGQAILTHQGNPEGINTLEDLCGKTVAFQRGTANEYLVEGQNEKCDDKIDMMDFGSDPEALTQLQNRRADAMMTDYPVALYQQLEAGGGDLFEVVGEQMGTAPYGIMVNKDRTELRDAIQAAVQAIIDDSTYLEVLTEWGAETGAIEEATINAGS